MVMSKYRMSCFQRIIRLLKGARTEAPKKLALGKGSEPQRLLLHPLTSDLHRAGHAYADAYTLKLIEWWLAQGFPKLIEWRVFLKQSFEFAFLREIPPLTPMRLAKALSRAGIHKEWKYIPASEPEYQRRREYGEQRPRVLKIYLQGL